MSSPQGKQWCKRVKNVSLLWSVLALRHQFIDTIGYGNTAIITVNSKQFGENVRRSLKETVWKLPRSLQFKLDARVLLKRMINLQA